MEKTSENLSRGRHFLSEQLIRFEFAVCAFDARRLLWLTKSGCGDGGPVGGLQGHLMVNMGSALEEANQVDCRNGQSRQVWHLAQAFCESRFR